MDNFNRFNKIELAIAIICLIVIVTIPPLGVLVGFIIVLTYLLIGKERIQKVKSIGLIKPNSWIRTVLLCLLLGAVIEISFQMVVNPIIEKFTSSRIDLTAYDNIRGNFTNYLLFLLLGWIVGGFLEEILFRGFLITRIAKIFKSSNIGNWCAILLTSFTFGFSHLYQGWSGVISTSLIALLLGFIFIKANKILWYTILIHGFINTTALTLMWLNLDKVLESLLFK